MNLDEIKKLKIVHVCEEEFEQAIKERRKPERSEISVHSYNIGTREPSVTFICMKCYITFTILVLKDDEPKYTLDEFKEMMEKMKYHHNLIKPED